jgi:hypothetical protein
MMTAGQEVEIYFDADSWNNVFLTLLQILVYLKKMR